MVFKLVTLKQIQLSTYIYNEINILFPAVFLTADLVFVYINHLDADTLFLTDYYKIHTNHTAVIIKRDAIFLQEMLAHEIGHVLGAGHAYDPSKRNQY